MRPKPPSFLTLPDKLFTDGVKVPFTGGGRASKIRREILGKGRILAEVLARFLVRMFGFLGWITVCDRWRF